MKNQTIIVTGGSNGMGKAMAARFASLGANVVITGRDQERLETAKSEVAQDSGRVLTVQMDVRNPDDVERMVKDTLSEFGAIDGLVNNAAGNFLCAAEDLSLNGWKSVIDIVLNGTWHCTQAVGKEWIKDGRKGHILNMVATYAWTAGAGVVHSASAKAGVLAMTRTLAVEWGTKYGIRLNAIAPGPIEGTGGAEKLILNETFQKAVLQTVPLKRFGTLEEIAGLATYLFSEEATYMNGECISLDGGQWLRGTLFPFS
ncbi:2,4-dienoyl-CoA reductase [Halalkalibacterium halodurans]|uniref:2,4-dienoyl-CoA reductase n=1 Tax=Halalkalibacterium halodurans TaxID=86665 RepID=UPI002AA9CE96|nr:2,4-dienoyl-CoA reductase [Halalkalibacterium halodurans]MDY7222702.1 2,4-dienoyl-CoA reductase [Halalkalibacterium halodurans]MDY7241923.1 2,4-dienoyl-CoA reductase [Halalkalibacterium halodurans]